MQRPQTTLALTLLSLCAAAPGYAAPPALMASSFMRNELSFEACQLKSREIMDKMNLEIEDHGNGTIGGFGEQSVALVNCHRLEKSTYVQIAVASQKPEAAEMIMNYIVSYLRTSTVNSDNRPIDAPALPPLYPH